VEFKKILFALLAAFPGLAAGPLAPAAYLRLLKQAHQALVVTTPGWNSVGGTLRRFEKVSGVWKQIGDPVPVVVGKNGLGWDAQLPPAGGSPDPIKKEGDGRSPAGIFSITKEFGFELSGALGGMKYSQLTNQTECVDDVNSRFYNQVLNRNEAAPDWNSSEKMREVTGYKWGAIVDYNSARTRGAGSCIFLHIWSGPDRGTAGCTAMEEETLRHILQDLDPRKHPILIQFPEQTFENLRQSWRLP
jgi:D-alanyl-D-alanine dipeptidase